MKKASVWAAVLAMAWLAAGSTAHAFEGGVSAGSGGDGRAYFDFGVFAYEDGAYDEARNHFRMALDFDPDNPKYHQYIGRTFLKQDRFDEAAVHLQRAMEINPDIPGLKHDTAMLHFLQGDDAQASALFERAAAESSDDVLARYYAGVTLFRLERYEKAAGYFLEAAEKSPEARARGRYYAGVAYQKSGQSDRALKLFERLMEDPNAGEFAQLAREWATVIREGGAGKRPWQLFLKLGRRYDDNVTLDPDDADLFTDESDWGTQLFFSGRYEFLRRDSFSMGAGYRHYRMDYDDLDRYDLTGSFGDAYAAYRIEPFTLRMVLAPTYYWADGDSYLRQYRLGPDLLWLATPRLLARLSYRYGDNAYFEDDGRTGHDQTVFSEAYYSILDGGGRLFGRLEYEDRSADAADEEYGQWRFRLGGSLELPWKLEAGVSGEYRARNYDAPDGFYGVEREDDRYTMDLSLSRPVFWDWLGVLAEYRYIRNDSNINDYEYTRNQFTLSVTATY